MKSKRLAFVVAVVVLALGLGWVLFVGLPRWYSARTAVVVPESTGPSAARKIKAHLFYVSEDGRRLTSIERDVLFGEGTAEQAKRTIEAQLEAAPAPLASAVPPGTHLRALYVTPRGDAFVDLSREVMAAHPGGSLNEIFTVYTIVDALAMNLPAITAVQILVDGRQVETLAGHVDLRRPLAKNLAWAEEKPAPTAEPPRLP